MIRLLRSGFFIFLLLAASCCCSSQVRDSSFSFTMFPSGVHFTPLKANIKEARIGIMKLLNQSNMKVDIGNSIDLVNYENRAEGVRYTAGIDFDGYALTDAYAGFRLQIDALDGLFGGNVTASKELEGSRLMARFRMLHHSAHYVDGHYSFDTGNWIDARYPSAFTRDFGEIILAKEDRLSTGLLKYYAGFSHAVLIRPVSLAREECLAGAEWSNGRLLSPCLDQPVTLYAAYQVTLMSAPAYVGANFIQAGVKFGTWNAKGAAFYVSYYSGPYPFGQYYDIRLESVGAGFMVDFF